MYVHLQCIRMMMIQHTCLLVRFFVAFNGIKFHLLANSELQTVSYVYNSLLDRPLMYIYT